MNAADTDYFNARPDRLRAWSEGAPQVFITGEAV